MLTEVKLYHGSVKIIEKPEFGKGNPRNDYGLGFYCTENPELAKEWACGSGIGGYANSYLLDVSGLTALNLSGPNNSALDWIAILVNNRVFDITNPIAAESKEYLTEHFLPDIGAYDIITGYRADDSYFTFALDFLNNTISLRQLYRAISLGSLGEQLVLKSRKAFSLISFTGSELADGDVYYAKRRRRDKEAREQYLRRERGSAQIRDDIFMIDVLREGMKHGDARL